MAKEEVDILAFSLNFCQARSEATSVIGRLRCKIRPRLSHQRLLESWAGPEPEIPGREGHHVSVPRPIGRRALDDATKMFGAEEVGMRRTSKYCGVCWGKVVGNEGFNEIWGVSNDPALSPMGSPHRGCTADVPSGAQKTRSARTPQHGTRLKKSLSLRKNQDDDPFRAACKLIEHRTCICNIATSLMLGHEQSIL
jgi:hypothetical protein